MLDWVSLLLRAIYYYGHIIGSRNFEVDFRTGRVFTTTRSTVYALANNVIIVLLSGYKLIGKASFIAHFGGAHKLHMYVEFTLTILRITAGLAILLNQWRFQSRVMLLVKDSLRLCLASPQLIRMTLWRFVLMFISGIVIDLGQVAFNLWNISNANAKIFLGIVQQLWISAILNLALAQHYLVMVFSGYYVSAMATICTTFRIFKEDFNDLETNIRDLLLSFAWSFFFYMAGILNLFMTLYIQDDHKEMIRLLEERTLFAPGLDVRLEQSFEILQLQLIRNPLKMDVLKLFPVSRQSTWTLSGSILLHSISLIQYDMDNFLK